MPFCCQPLVVLLLSLYAGAALASARPTDWIEFEQIDDAADCGWINTEKTRLTTTDECQVGGHALRVDAETQSQEYSGIELQANVDLSGAGPRDTLVFHVNQNFGGGMVVQLWTEQGGINRSFAVNPNTWTRVELDLDLRHWENPRQAAAWSKVARIQFYSKSFSSAGQYMILDGLTATVGGKPIQPIQAERIDNWTFPQQTETAWRIGNDHAAWAISKSTGQVVGGWNARTREEYLLSLVGRYHLEDRRSLTSGVESQDKVIEATFDEKNQKIELTCSNPTVGDLIIRKQYFIDGNKLFQRVGIKTTNSDLQFVTYNSQASFTSEYRNGGYYMGGGDGGGPLVPAPQISEWQKVVQYQNTTKGMLLHQPEKGYSFAHVRTRLDDKFVWPYFTGAVASYVEAMNMLHYTPDGWDMSLGTSRLSTEKEISYTQFVSIFEGDWQKFLNEEYPALPEVRQALAEIPPAPDWVGDIKMGAGGDINRLRQMVQTTDEGVIMALVCLNGSWADYYVDQGVDCAFGGHITGPELKAWVDKLKSLSPRIKVGFYMWTLSTTDNTRIYQKHPEWFRYGNKDGEPLNTFPGFWLNFAYLLSIRDCYNEILSQIDHAIGYLDLDFIFLDDPKAINPIDWKSGEFTRDDLSFDFFLDVKKIAAKHGPDTMVFFNNRGNPYGDLNYIEAREEIRANYWRKFAGIAAVTQEFVAATRPRGRIVPLYFIQTTRREYMNKVLSLGWVPDLTYCGVLESRPFFQAAYEVGSCGSTPVRYTPDWKRDKNTNVESYAVQRQGDAGTLISFLNHAEQAETIPVTVDLTSLKLDRNGPVFVWEYAVENALEYEGVATESLVRKIYAQTGWQLDRVTQRRLLYAGPYRDELSFQLSMEPLRLHQLYITPRPAGIYSENDLPANYLFGRMPKVTLAASPDWKNGTAEIQIDSQRDQAEILLYLPAATHRLARVSLDGNDFTPDWVYEGQDVFPVVKVGKGTHTLALNFSSAEPAQPATVDGFTVAAAQNDAKIELPGVERAVITIEKNNRVLFNRMVSQASGELRLPLAAARKEAGEYVVCVKMIAGDDGRLVPVENARVALQLPADMPDLNLPPERPVIMPGERDIQTVNRQINELEILSTGRITTPPAFAEMQPELKPLLTRVDPEHLTLEAGTSRLVMQGQENSIGAAFAGFEIKQLRKVQVRLSNTFYNAFHQRGKGFHIPEAPNSRNFAGIVVDYHTPNGYARRVSFAVGVLHKDLSSNFPDYGKSSVPDEIRDLGSAMIESPEQIFALDLEKFAPSDWDGQVWFSVGTDWVCSSRMLKLQILAANDAVTGPFLDGVDPTAFKAEYEKPRVLKATRSPGGVILDGLPFEEWWGGSGKTDQFYLYGGNGMSRAKTSVKMMYDEKNLYVAFICQEADRRKPLIIGGAAYDDDEVEIWIDHDNDQKTFRQVIVNGANTKLEYGEAGPTAIGATSAVHVVEGESWMVEMAIPFAGLGVEKPTPGQSWRLSLCRYRPEGKKNPAESIIWAPLKAGGFKDLENFGTVVFE